MFTSQDTIEAATHQLLGEGYNLIESWDLIEPGVRVYNGSQHYFEARRHGTATVLACFEKNPSPWARKYGRPDVEFIVRRNDGSIGRWADYHMGIATVQPAFATKEQG